ncbi:double-strand break repair protein AddB [soil metagenome]
MTSAPNLYTIPTTTPFADALATGLIDRFGADPMTLARGIVLLPNNRSKRTVSEAFVRASDGGLLLPRLVAIGDSDLEEAIGAALDPVDAEPVPPAVAPLQRRMILARLIAEKGDRDPAEAVRLAGDLARTLDALLVEEIAPERLRDLPMAEELSDHWRRALAMFELVLDRWPAELKRLGRIDLAERRRILLDRLGKRWRSDPPAGFVCAAGITATAPAFARLLGVVARLERGMVVFPGLAVDMPDPQWEALGPHDPDPSGARKRSIETHPQYQLKLLLERMAMNRAEVQAWPVAGPGAGAARAEAIAHALAPAEFTDDWTRLKPDVRGLAVAELATPAEEAQAIALALREALEEPGRTAALVTPDRALARRVSAHLARWGIEIDDSAGRPLSGEPSGTLLAILAEAAAQRFAPLPLLALLKHPLVRFGDERVEWLEGALARDLALRGPRPKPGLDGVSEHLKSGLWWAEVRDILEPIAAMFEGDAKPLPELIAGLRECGQALCGDALWTGPAGRAAAELLGEIEAQAGEGPEFVPPESLAPMLATLMEEVAVRPPQGGHPRLAIYGLIEARLQTADLMILGGLNEGVWPGQPAPDPWLAPRIRAELGLPGLERRIGVSAHDLASALGASSVLLTRARRDATSPSIASRFWLRLQAMAGEKFARASDLEHWARALDDPGVHLPAERPAPLVPAELRPKRISVTEVDRLKADPFAFYARRVLGLQTIDPVDADPSAAWRGTAVHKVLEMWGKVDRDDPSKLHGYALAMLADERTHPMMRALWRPRLMEAVDWIALELEAGALQGRRVLAVEDSGEIELAGVKLRGKFDRVDALPDGGLAIIDYKTGKPPSAKAVREGFSLQLGLLGVIAEMGGFPGISGRSTAFEYWSLGRSKEGAFGYVDSPVSPKKRDPIPWEDFTTIAVDKFEEAAGKWLTGAEPFTAKLHPEYAPYGDYDQLMRRDEWYGRER